MALNIWKGACTFLFVVVLFQFYLIISETRIPHVAGFLPSRAKNDDTVTASPPTLPPDYAPILPSTSNDEWAYDTKRDHLKIGLTSDQCDIAFPDLYYEIDRAATVWKEKKHTISPQDISIDWRKDAAFQAMIYDGQLRILRAKHALQKGGYGRRALYVLAQLNRALLGAAAAGEKVPNIEFAVVVDDMSLLPGPDDTKSVWAFTRELSSKNENKLWIIPDFNFYASPPRASSWLEEQRRADLHDVPITEKIPKVIWRGAKWTNEFVRGRLLDVTDGKDYADVENVDWKVANNTMRMDDMCKYMFTVHTEGRSWSGRLKFLLNCDSVLIVHELAWTAQFYHLLKDDGSDQNYIAVKRDFSDLEEKIQYYLANPQAAQRIADNAVATFRDRYTSPAAESCYWRRLVRSYSEVSFTPEPFEMVRRNVSGVEIEDARLRGITYEEILLYEGASYPPEHED